MQRTQPSPAAIPVVVLGVRSQDEEPGKDSVGDQVRIIVPQALGEPGRYLYAEPFTDHGSGYHERGPAASRPRRRSTPRSAPPPSTARPSCGCSSRSGWRAAAG